MTPESKPNKSEFVTGKETTSSFVPLVVFIASAAFLYLSLREKPVQPSIQTPANNEVNLNIKKTEQNVQIEKIKATEELEKLRTMKNKTPVFPQTNSRLSLEYESKSEDVAQVLGRTPKENLNSPSPDEVIQLQHYEIEMIRAQDAAYKKKYAKEFIENARRKGYEIKLNADYKVISVRKLKPEAFPSLRDISGKQSHPK